MSTGLEIRAQIDTENVKGLLLINGGGAVALLAFLPTILGKPNFDALARSVIWSLLLYQIGLISAVIHNRLRRICSLTYEQHQYEPPPGKILGRKLGEPFTCFASITFMWISLIAFFLAGLLLVNGGFETLKKIDLSNKQEKITTPQTLPKTQPSNRPKK